MIEICEVIDKNEKCKKVSDYISKAIDALISINKKY
jgi:hypothetical protein